MTAQKDNSTISPVDPSRIPEPDSFACLVTVDKSPSYSEFYKRGLNILKPSRKKIILDRINTLQSNNEVVLGKTKSSPLSEGCLSGQVALLTINRNREELEILRSLL